MALKIRQGLEINRAGFVPEEGELIYTTDDKLVYIGDGSTPGGNLVASGGSVTYSISAETGFGGADLRLSGSDSSIDDLSFVGSGIITVSRTDSNTITISASSGGSGTVNSALTGAIAYYSADGDVVDGSSSDFNYDADTQTVRIANIDNDKILSVNPIFRLINTNNESITFGGIVDTTEYSGKVTIVDKGPHNPLNPVLTSFTQVHDDAQVNCLTFFRARGTLTATTGIDPGDAIGAILFAAQTDAFGDVSQTALMGVISEGSFTPGSSLVPGTFFIQNAHPTFGLQTSFYINSNLDTNSVYYHYARLGIYTPQISTEDSSALTIVPVTVFNADVEIQNDLYVTNKIFANEFVSSSTGTPEIYATQDLTLIADPYSWIFKTDSTLEIPGGITNLTSDITLTANTAAFLFKTDSTLEIPGGITNTSGNVDITANTTVLTVNSGSDSLTVPSTLDTVDNTTDLVLGGFNAQISVAKSGGFVNVQTDDGTYAFEFTVDGGLSMPLLTSPPSNPTSGTIYMANNANWDPLNRAGTAPYAVLWDGTQWTSISGA
jgi:hypothetical protein